MAEQRKLLRAATLALAGCAVALLGWRRCAAVEAAPPSAAPEATAGAAARPLDARAPGPARAAAAAVGPQITGVVLGALERPLPAARVSLVTRSSEAEVAATADDAGRFTLRGLPAGPVSVRVTAAGYATAQLGDLRPDRAPAERLRLPAIRLQRSVRYHGIVTSEGRGLAGVTVRVLPELAARSGPTALVRVVTTDERGAFEVLEAPPPPVLVAVEAEGFRPQVGGARRVAAAGPALRFECTPWPTLRGVVTDRVTQQPLPGASVTLRTRDELGSDLHAEQADTDANGAFRFSLPDAPAVALITQLPGFVTEVTEISSAARGQQQLVQLGRAAVIRGAVRRDGDPCQASLSLRRLADHEVLATAETTPAGDFALRGVPAGDYELLVDPVAGARRRQRVSARTDRPLVLEVDVQTGATCAGRVLGDIALPAEVVLRQQDGFARRGLVRADGTFVVEGLSAGEWSALAYSKQRTWAAKAARMLLARRPWRADLAVSEAAAQGAQRVPLDVAAPSRRLGTLRAQLPPADAGATFSLEPLDEAGRSVPPGLLRGAVDSTGALRMDAVLPGAWRLLLQRAAGPHTAKVQVTPGATCWLEPTTLQPRRR